MAKKTLPTKRASSKQRSIKNFRGSKQRGSGKYDSLFIDIDEELIRSLRLQRGLNAVR